MALLHCSEQKERGSRHEWRLSDVPGINSIAETNPLLEASLEFSPASSVRSAKSARLPSSNQPASETALRNTRPISPACT